MLARASGLGRQRPTTSSALWQTHQARGARPARAPVLPAAAVGGRRTARRAASRSRASRPRPGSRRSASATRAGALRAHRARSPAGVSRRATIQRHLMPGHDPVVRRRRRPRLRPARVPAAQRRARRRRTGSCGCCATRRVRRESLTRVLSGSRFVGELLERIPEAAAWLEDRRRAAAPIARRPARREARGDPAAARHDRTPRRGRSGPSAGARSCGSRCRRSSASARSRSSATALTDVTESHAPGARRARSARRRPRRRSSSRSSRWAASAGASWASARMPTSCTSTGRTASTPEAAQRARCSIVAELRAAHRGHRAAARPRRRPAARGPQRRRSRARSTSYRAYYARWSLTWEAQALLRARGVAGDAELIARLHGAGRRGAVPGTSIRRRLREIKRIKARVENERLPQGADPARHLKLGRGSLSDVEWFVQLLQLEHAPTEPALRTHVDARRAGAPRSSTGSSPPSMPRTLRAAWRARVAGCARR